MKYFIKLKCERMGKTLTDPYWDKAREMKKEVESWPAWKREAQVTSYQNKSRLKVYSLKTTTIEGLPARLYIILEDESKVVTLLKKIITKDETYFGIKRKFWNFYYSEEKIILKYETFLAISTLLEKR